jgi:hypothetical protein
MTNRLKLSRRSFTKVIGGGAAFAALRPITKCKVQIAARASNDLQGGSFDLAHENPYGTFTCFTQAMTDSSVSPGAIRDEYAEMLSEELAKLHGCRRTILLGDGSGEVFKLCATALTSKDKKAGDGESDVRSQ